MIDPISKKKSKLDHLIFLDCINVPIGCQIIPVYLHTIFIRLAYNIVKSKIYRNIL